MKKQEIKELLSTHALLQLGTYLDRLEHLNCGAIFASSDTIKDHYWNYAYNIDSDIKQIPNVIQEVKKYSESISRSCVIYSLKSEKEIDVFDSIPFKESEEELWMIYNSDHSPEIRQNDLKISELRNSQPSNDFLDVFKDAYGSGPIDSPGYTGLPEEYINAIKDSNPVEDNVKIVHFLGKIEEKNISIASIFIKKPIAGLYNVGTIHQNRRAGYAWDVSASAIDYAYKEGCSTIFLQTQEASEVESFYEKMGFKRAFVGAFLTI